MSTVAVGCSNQPPESRIQRFASKCSAVDLRTFAGTVKLIAVRIILGGVTASTEVIAVKRHTGVHASVIACKNTIANQTLAYAA